MLACEWPSDLGPIPPLLERDAFKRAIATFPCGLGLGWDDIHPRALLRLGNVVLLTILRLLFLCECLGVWPELSSCVVMAMLPKSSSGIGCIGHFPWLPKVWAKARRSVAVQWEKTADLTCTQVLAKELILRHGSTEFVGSFRLRIKYRRMECR